MKDSIFHFITSCFVIIFFLTSCKDKSPTPSIPQNPQITDSSWWLVDTNRYIAYNASVTGSSNTAIISGTSYKSNKNKFQIIFHLPYIPANGDFLLDCGNPATNVACMKITYKGFPYEAKAGSAAYLQADSSNQRAVLKLSPTWFYSVFVPGDSISINGVFQQP